MLGLKVEMRFSFACAARKFHAKVAEHAKGVRKNAGKASSSTLAVVNRPGAFDKEIEIIGADLFGCKAPVFFFGDKLHQLEGDFLARFYSYRLCFLAYRLFRIAAGTEGFSWYRPGRSSRDS